MDLYDKLLDKELILSDIEKMMFKSLFNSLKKIQLTMVEVEKKTKAANTPPINLVDILANLKILVS